VDTMTSRDELLRIAEWHEHQLEFLPDHIHIPVRDFHLKAAAAIRGLLEQEPAAIVENSLTGECTIIDRHLLSGTELFALPVAAPASGIAIPAIGEECKEAGAVAMAAPAQPAEHG
jgi:hypothetical protein